MTVLSAPSTSHENKVLHAVIVAVAIISAIGAGWILLSFALFKPLRSFRHQLILGLAISDFWMAINFLSSALMNLSGLSIGVENQKVFCSFNGFMIQVFVVQTDYWVLAIAVCTYLILSDHKRQSTWIQEHRIVIWLLPWFFSILWAALGLGIVGYGDIGAWCWFTSDRVRLFVNFIPRWTIVIIILGLYIRLYFLIHRAHNRFISFGEDAAENLQPGFSTSRNRPSTSFNISSSREDGCEIGRMMTYPLVYIIIWTVPTAIRIYQATTNKAAPFAIGTVDKSCIVIQGFADAVVYGFNEHIWNMWRGVFNISSPFK
ncbi:G protein-coupled glucose receptor regulating Gpa2-domain-containing protein [Bisporella sp. PMI_857]|nr:G protein-coupled glucose receptor regulating Gpa2-domain-containing protein [Bisporella sp. PMI_857]